MSDPPKKTPETPIINKGVPTVSTALFTQTFLGPGIQPPKLTLPFGKNNNQVPLENTVTHSEKNQEIPDTAKVPPANENADQDNSTAANANNLDLSSMENFSPITNRGTGESMLDKLRAKYAAEQDQAQYQEFLAFKQAVSSTMVEAGASNTQTNWQANFYREFWTTLERTRNAQGEGDSLGLSQRDNRLHNRLDQAGQREHRSQPLITLGLADLPPSTTTQSVSLKATPTNSSSLMSGLEPTGNRAHSGNISYSENDMAASGSNFGPPLSQIGTAVSQGRVTSHPQNTVTFAGHDDIYDARPTAPVEHTSRSAVFPSISQFAGYPDSRQMYDRPAPTFTWPPPNSNTIRPSEYAPPGMDSHYDRYPEQSYRAGYDNSRASLPPGVAATNLLKTFGTCKLKYSGTREENIEDFLRRVSQIQRCTCAGDGELLVALPMCLQGQAWSWYNTRCHLWRTWTEAQAAFRQHFAGKSFQQSLKREIEARQQLESESLRTYISEMRRLFNQTNPLMSVEDQVMYTIRNMTDHYNAVFLGRGIQNMEHLDAVADEVEALSKIKPLSRRPTRGFSYDAHGSDPRVSNSRNASRPVLDSYGRPQLFHYPRVEYRDRSMVPRYSVPPYLARESGNLPPVTGAPTGQTRPLLSTPLNAVFTEGYPSALPSYDYETHDENLEYWHYEMEQYPEFPEQLPLGDCRLAAVMRPVGMRGNTSRGPPSHSPTSRIASAAGLASKNLDRQTATVPSATIATNGDNCYNCEQPGHQARDCQAPRRVYCYECGLLGFVKSCCPRCLKGNNNWVV